jgi:hypothetical protein
MAGYQEPPTCFGGRRIDMQLRDRHFGPIAVEFYLSRTRAAVNYRVAGASVRLADAWPLAGALHD